MRKIFSVIFSEEYVNRAAIGHNLLLLSMYRFAYPFSALLNKLHFSPNIITSQSILFAVLAMFALVYDDSSALYLILWVGSILLDFCDGTVARMTKNTRKTAFRYDHFSDLFKINLVIFGAGVRYDDELVWIFAFSASFFFMYYMVLNHETAGVRKYSELTGISKKTDGPVKFAGNRKRDRYRVIAFLVKYESMLKIYKSIYAVVGTINGHTLLVFLFLPFSEEYAIGAFLYLTIISLIGCKSRISSLRSMPKL